MSRSAPFSDEFVRRTQRSMPATIRLLSYISPLTYANAGLRKVMLVGGGFGETRFGLAVLGVFAVVMLLLSVLSMRHQVHTAQRGRLPRQSP